MFKKKPIYIIGIVLFTLILIADLVIYFIPAGGGMGSRLSFNGENFNAEDFQGEMPEDFSMPENGEIPEDFGEGRPQNGEMPQGFGGGKFNGEMPEGFNLDNFGGQRPQGEKSDGEGDAEKADREETAGENGEANESPEMLKGFNAGGFDSGRGGNGALATLRKAFIPILIICVLGNGFCIFMLICVKKKEKNDEIDDDNNENDINDDNNDTTQHPDSEESDAVRHKRDKINTVLSVVAVGLVLAVIISSLASGGNTSELIAENEILENEATVNNIASTFSGSGTLQSSDAEAIEIPSSVTVTSYTVKNGQLVEKGDVIAKVDKKSVQNAIYETQKLIDKMDEEIADEKNDTLSSTITVRADGRVKAIYAKEGESVSSAMYDNGALIVISLGGSMSVEFTTDSDVKTGEKVYVTLSDGKKIEGKVQQIKNKKVTVTVTDNGTSLNDDVTVSSQGGTTLGKGKLYVSSPLNVTSYVGTVKSIHVSVGDKVNVGNKLITLTDTQNKARYQHLLRERENLTELISNLSQMYKDGTVKANQSGFVSQLNDDIAYTENEKNNSEEATAESVAYSGLSNSSSLIKPLTLSVSPFVTGTESTSSEETTQVSPETTQSSEQPPQPSAQPTMPDNDSSKPQIGQGASNTTSNKNQYKDGKYAGVVTKISYGAILVNISDKDMTDKTISDLEALIDAVFNTSVQYTPNSQIPVYEYKNGKPSKSSVGAIQTGDKVYIHIINGDVSRIDFIANTKTPTQTQGNNSTQNTVPNNDFAQGIPQDSSNSGNFSDKGFTNGNFAGGSMQIPSMDSGVLGQQAVTEEEEATYIVATSSLCAITPNETMSVKISVDELDVSSLEVGQTANITLDALPGQSIKGTVKKLSAVGLSEDGGGTKYTATITVSRIEEMLDGMNATIIIETSNIENTLTIPAAAVCEDGNRTFVYTAVGNGATELKAPVDVITGVSDGTNIEVLEGLSEGDTVYYSYADSVTYSIGK